MKKSWGERAALAPVLVAAVAIGLAVLAAVRATTDANWLPLLLASIAVLTVSFFFAALLREARDKQRKLLLRNEELFELYRAGLDIHGGLALDEVLQDIVDRARAFLKARYGALSVTDTEGKILEFVTSGVSDAHRERIGAPPMGKGLLGVPLVQGERLRVSSIKDDARSAGFPENHPSMTSLLAVPLECSGLCGNLYLAEKETADSFSTADEEALVRFGRLASKAIDTADKHDKLTGEAVSDERGRIARELHDGLAQDLAAIGVRAQVAQTQFEKGDFHEAAGLLSDLEASSRVLQRDIREEIGGLRNLGEPGSSLQETARSYAEEWSSQQGVPIEIQIAGQTRVGPDIRLQFQRILQEALSNVARHAEAKHVSLSMTSNNGWIQTEIHDDGLGLPTSDGGTEVRRGGFGLRIMRERAEGVGGNFDIGSHSGDGTRLRFSLPVRQEGS